MEHSLGSRLVLGSANFGLNYGLANDRGKLSNKELRQIIKVAEMAGVDTVDTAQAYGDSEPRLGSVLKSHFKIVTKIDVGLSNIYCENSIHNLVSKSLKRLEVSHLYGVLLHRPELLLGVDGTKIVSELRVLKEKGLIKKIGISIYSPNILNEILKLTDLDIIQAPFNVFDQRILSSGWSKRLKERGTEIHIRSVFLQGLLLMQRQDLHQWFEINWPQLFDSWYEFQELASITADEVTLGLALQQPWIDKIVVGVDSAQQLHRLLEIERKKSHYLDPCLTSSDPDLIDPSKWKIK